MTNRNRILASLGVLILCSVFGASQAFAVLIGGKVLTLTNPPAAVANGVSVSVYPSGPSTTTTGGDGSWQLDYTGPGDPVLRIAASATDGTVETYTKFPLTLLDDYQTTPPIKYDISAVPSASMGAVPPGSCAVIGFALKYTSLGYPAAQTFLAGVTVTPTPTVYILADGVNYCVPNPLLGQCLKTTASGAWVGVHVPAEAPASYGGTISAGGSSCSEPPPSIVLSGGDVTCIANTANVTGLVHPTLP